MIDSCALRIYQGAIEGFQVGVVAAREGEVAGLWLADLDPLRRLRWVVVP